MSIFSYEVARRAIGVEADKKHIMRDAFLEADPWLKAVAA